MRQQITEVNRLFIRVAALAAVAFLFGMCVMCCTKPSRATRAMILRQLAQRDCSSPANVPKPTGSSEVFVDNTSVINHLLLSHIHLVISPGCKVFATGSVHPPAPNLGGNLRLVASPTSARSVFCNWRS
jgi:hypothetical protein